MTEKQYKEYAYLTSTIEELKRIKESVSDRELRKKIIHNSSFGNEYFPQIEHNLTYYIEQEITIFKNIRDKL